MKIGVEYISLSKGTSTKQYTDVLSLCIAMQSLYQNRVIYDVNTAKITILAKRLGVSARRMSKLMKLMVRYGFAIFQKKKNGRKNFVLLSLKAKRAYDPRVGGLDGQDFIISMRDLRSISTFKQAREFIDEIKILDFINIQEYSRDKIIQQREKCQTTKSYKKAKRFAKDHPFFMKRYKYLMKKGCEHELNCMLGESKLMDILGTRSKGYISKLLKQLSAKGYISISNSRELLYKGEDAALFALYCDYPYGKCFVIGNKVYGQRANQISLCIDFKRFFTCFKREKRKEKKVFLSSCSNKSIISNNIINNSKKKLSVEKGIGVTNLVTDSVIQTINTIEPTLASISLSPQLCS